MTEKIKVMIVDDMALVRQLVSQALATDPRIDVVATASEPIFALQQLKAQRPDVLVLDIEMPRMDGIAFLMKVMAEHPIPTVVCSSLAGQGGQTTFEALAAGAVSIISKPKLGLTSFFEDSANEIVHAVHSAARANMLAVRRTSALVTSPALRGGKHTADIMHSATGSPVLARSTDQVVAIGTSTGGTEALAAVLVKLPTTCLGILIVQHMPEKFTALFAKRLNNLCHIEVREAKNGDRVMPGRALIAPGGRHMMLKRSGAQYVVEVVDGPLVNRHRPSVDVLFRSVAKFAGANALGIIMTGMGDDGARGLKEMHDAGAKTIAQDEASCVVFGMPKEAIKLGAADLTISLEQIPAAIINHGKRA